MTNAMMDEGSKGAMIHEWSDEVIDDEINTDFRALDMDWCESVRGLVMRVRDDMLATIATQAARIADLERRADEIMGIGTPYLDEFSEMELERYSQTSPPEMFRNCLDLEADNERLRAELAEKQKYILKLEKRG